MTDERVRKVTDRLIERSTPTRKTYIQHCVAQRQGGKIRKQFSCGNLAHTIAASCASDKNNFLNFTSSNLAVVTSYNDMVSAHAPYQGYPQLIKEALLGTGHTCQVAGGVPAMCDGITQGQVGMDLSLFSRDIIAQSTAISLSHNVFDAALLLGVCDKIAPGMLIGALSFGHLPTAFIPSGLMPTGVDNDEKVSIRQRYAANEVGKDALLDMECRAYHSQGTCTFYGTANTNQLVFEAMGLMLPGSAFIQPSDPLREALTTHAAQRLASEQETSSFYHPLYEVVTEQSVINGIVALLASGGSTNHTIHLVAVARAAGIALNWDDIDALSQCVPLLVNVYPNGSMDMNAFQDAGGVPALMTCLDELGLLNRDVVTSFGDYASMMQTPSFHHGQLSWGKSNGTGNPEVIASKGKQFSETGGIRLISGNIGRGVVKVSAVAAEHQQVTAPARVFYSQHDVEKAYQRGELNCDCIVVVAYNGPAANGMPELHKLMPILGNIQKQGYKIALLTDGRLSGASGKVLSVIHMSPEASRGGAIGLVNDGDMITIDCVTGQCWNHSQVDQRVAVAPDLERDYQGWGRGLFQRSRKIVSSAEDGASLLY